MVPVEIHDGQSPRSVNFRSGVIFFMFLCVRRSLGIQVGEIILVQINIWFLFRKGNWPRGISPQCYKPSTVAFFIFVLPIWLLLIRRLEKHRSSRVVYHWFGSSVLVLFVLQTIKTTKVVLFMGIC